MIPKLREKPTVKALVIRTIKGEPHFLYLEKLQPRKFRTTQPNKADIPGGAVEPGETRIQAVLREIVEETGLTVKHEKIIREWRYERPEKGDVLIGTTHLCKHVSGEPHIRAEEADELEAPRWRKVTDTRGLPKWIVDDLKAAGY